MQLRIRSTLDRERTYLFMLELKLNHDRKMSFSTIWIRSDSTKAQKDYKVVQILHMFNLYHEW